MVSISYINIVCIMFYIIVLYHLSYKFIWNDDIYTDITSHYWDQAVENFELNCDTMHMYC